MKHITLVGLAVLLLAACMHEKNAEPRSEAPAHVSVTDLDGSHSSQRMTKTATYRFQVADAAQSLDRIERIVSKYPAHIADSKMSVSGTRIEHKLTIRISPDQFDELMKEVDSLSISTESRNIMATDVTREFADLDSRLKTKREVHERLKEILRTKAGTIEDVLAAERQLGEVQEEIEAATSTLNTLKDRIAYSRIDIEMYQILRQEASLASGIGKRFGNAFTSGFDGIVEVLIGLTHLWPLILIVTAGGFIYRRKKQM